MPVRYISPTGSGARDGSSWANAGTIGSLSKFIAAAGPGGEVLLRADHGAYHLSGQISIAAGGTSTAPVTIRGVNGAGGSMRAELDGTRADHWTPGAAVGSEAFRLLTGANNLHFEDLAFRNVGNGAFRVGANIQNLTVEHVDAVNVQRFIEDNVSGTATSASINGLTVRDVTVSGYSSGAIHLRYDTRHVVIENVVGDSERQDGGLYVVGVHLDDTVHDVVLRHVTMRNAYGHGGSSEYWNGDGFATEGRTYNIRFVDTVASGNTDAGYDLKSSDTVLLRAVAEDNNRNYRFWSHSITLEDSVSLNPHHFGGSGSSRHVWMAKGASAHLNDFHFSDATQPHTLFDLLAGNANLYLEGTPIPVSYADLLRVGSGSKLHFLGGNGNDSIKGSAFNDVLDGRLGNDKLTGGSGLDNFVFDTAPNSLTNADRITDFTHASDEIVLKHSIFAAAGPVGVLAAGAFFSGTAAHDSSDRVIYNSASGFLTYDWNGNLAGGAVHFATVAAHLIVSNTDFLIIG